jgi:hypothetical protein
MCKGWITQVFVTYQVRRSNSKPESTEGWGTPDLDSGWRVSRIGDAEVSAGTWDFYLSERRLGRLSVAEPFTSLNLLHSFSRGESAMHGFRALPSPDFTFSHFFFTPQTSFQRSHSSKGGGAASDMVEKYRIKRKMSFLGVQSEIQLHVHCPVGRSGFRNLIVADPNQTSVRPCGFISCTFAHLNSLQLAHSLIPEFRQGVGLWSCETLISNPNLT